MPSGTDPDRDTIAAIATAPGPAAIGIIRISGPSAKNILACVFTPENNKTVPSQPDRTMVKGSVRNRDGVVIDDVLVCIYTGPHSYSGEDSVEIFGHGGTYNLQLVMETCLACGARQARPGEFSRRAFLHGKMDLTRVEAVNALAMAQDRSAHEAAISQLGGSFFQYVKSAKERMTGLLSEIEARLEYPEDVTEDLDRKKAADFFKSEKKTVDSHLVQLERSRLESQGVRVAITGSTNTGKSSLLNCLTGKNSALVTDFHGTTRDTVTGSIRVKGILFEFHDTAGLMEQTRNEADKAAIGRTFETITESELVILLFDKSRKPVKSDVDCLDFIRSSEKPFISVINKSDLSGPTDLQTVKSLAGDVPVLEISAKFGNGIAELKKNISDRFISGSVPMDERFIYSERYKDVFHGLAGALDSALENLFRNEPLDKTAEDIRHLLALMGELTGETISEEVLDRIFSRFCLGK
jgi:tRNA modification GTPase